MTHDRSSQGCRIEVKGLLVIALGAAFEAGDRILEIYNSNFNVWYKGDASPLTEADRCSHEIISRHLSETSVRSDSRFPVLSEEGKNIPYEERRRWQHFWLVDPLDGTKEFVKRNGEFTVNIALIDGDRPVAGVIYAPVNDVAYFAGKGLGAYKMNGNDLSAIFSRLTHGYETFSGKALTGVIHADEILDSVLSAATLLKTSRPLERGSESLKIVGSRSHASRDFDNFVEHLKARYKTVDLVSAGSSLKFCLVAEGKADLYPRFGPTMEWDTGAGDIIVKEAGGRVLNAETRSDLIYNKRELLNPSFIAVSNYELINEE
jgi:3'(2'), 5'-bisphosphate nucleotidase